MEQLQNGKKKPRRKRRKREDALPEKPTDAAAAAAAAAADNGTSQHCVETYPPAQLEFVDDGAEEVRMHSIVYMFEIQIMNRHQFVT